MNQGKRQQQIKDSNTIAMFTIIGLITTIVVAFIYNLVTTL
jgi:hypothetical protein